MIKKVVNVVFLMIYLAILAAYSYIVYDHDHGSKLGLVSSIAVIINDLYVYLMYNARIINRISIISLIMFCSRVFICLGGSDYWVYGYLVIFVWLQCIIALGIVEKRLPYNSEMIAQPAENLLSAKKTQFVNLAHVPEFIFLIIVVGLVGSIVVATAVKPDGVYLKDLPVGEGVPYEAATALAILIVVSFLFVASWIRSFKRKIDRTAAQTYVYLCAYRVDVYYIFSLICYMCTCFWTLGIYAFADNKNILINGFLLPLIMFFFFNIVIIYMLNNYYFVEDINGINRSIVAHNKRVDALRVKAKTLKQRMNEEGPEAVYGEEHGRIVQKVMDIEVARRQAAKLTKQIDGNDADSSIKRSATGALGRQIVTNKPKAIQN